MINVIYIVTLIATATILIHISIGAWRVPVAFAKWTGVSICVVLITIFAATASVMMVGLYRLNARSAPVPDLKIAGTSEQIERGHAIADGFCASCHSKTGTLTGGSDIGKKFRIPVGSFVSSNLTSAGSLKSWSDGEIFRAIRNGIDADGRWLIVMSLTSAGNLSDDDIKSLIAYMRSLPAGGVQSRDPPDEISPLGLAMLGAGLLPRGKPVFTGTINAPARGPTAQYGEYIASYQDCRQCHGDDLAGGKGGLAPTGPDLNLVKEWTRTEFVTTMRTGADPNGHEIDTNEMPWRDIGKMDDVELGALHEYLIHMPGASASAASQAKAPRWP
jgi:mono/diheme cytochrome c family protein